MGGRGAGGVAGQVAVSSARDRELIFGGQVQSLLDPGSALSSSRRPLLIEMAAALPRFADCDPDPVAP